MMREISRDALAVCLIGFMGGACSERERSTEPPPPPLEVMPPRSEAPPVTRPSATNAERIGLPPTPAVDVPTGRYKVELKRTRDGCTPAQTLETTTEAIVVTRRLASVSASASVVNAPVGLADPALPLHRIELPLHVGESRVNFLKLHPPNGVASVTLRTTLKDLRADGFTLAVQQSFEGIEVDAVPASSGAAATRSCLAEHEARFTLERVLCPASCAIDARYLPDGGVTAGDCVCAPRDGG